MGAFYLKNKGKDSLLILFPLIIYNNFFLRNRMITIISKINDQYLFSEFRIRFHPRESNKNIDIFIKLISKINNKITIINKNENIFRD